MVLPGGVPPCQAAAYDGRVCEVARSRGASRLLLRVPVCRDRRLDLRLDRLHVEARPLLHRRELDEGLRGLRDLLLDEDETPELVREPVVVGERADLAVRHARALEWIEAQIDQDRPVDLERGAQPAAGLVREPIFEVVDPDRAQRALGEVEDLMPFRWTLAGDHVGLVIAVEMHLVGPVADLLALEQLVGDAGVAGGGEQGRKPVEPGEDAVLDLAGRHLARPAQDGRHAEAAFECRALAAGERSSGHHRAR